MTSEQKIAFRRECETALQDYGFAYKGQGCPCNGAPLIYRTLHGNKPYEADVWHGRGLWRIYDKTTKVAEGTDPNGINKAIMTIWD